MKKYLLFLLTWVALLSSGCKKNKETPAADLPKVTIGTQVWSVYNLDVTTYSNGDPIPQVADVTQWQALTTGAWCYYNNDPSNDAVYGKLYNWYAVSDPRGLAPNGWHIPNDAEWLVLNNYLGGSAAASGKMKAVSSLWQAPNTGASNSSGFLGLPGGIRLNGVFKEAGQSGNWWSASETQPQSSIYYPLHYSVAYAYGVVCNHKAGLSVRCIKN
jgi:uncharacterized protein (TIGR02145 family)